MENKILPNESDNLNEWLFEHHTHAELANIKNPDMIVYTGDDVLELIKLLRNGEI